MPVFKKRIKKKKKTCDKADPGSKKGSKEALYWLDPESKKELESKAYYGQNRELIMILASKQKAKKKAKRDISRINRHRKRNPMR